MKIVLQAQTAVHPLSTVSKMVHSAASRLSPAPMAPDNVVVVEKQAPMSTPTRGDEGWGDIIGHSHYKLVQTDEYRETRNPLGMTIRSHRQHTCKVCSVLRDNRKRAAQSSYYCRECADRRNGGMIFLCDKPRPHDPKEYRNATCSQIWHLMWNNGESIPQTGTSFIRMRKKLKTDSD
ncbi:hypothetical protein PPTG_09219 [Phytophthora nicotianae INRA-310]|uniref:PiggyBac transposable element-derived protein 4 C-terminal zinc-ribbon domain-containing protein n=1 Tax=Phytophthora nicotianae (strain INRA-310) TaxID=761204 RepID=W2QIL2_PHYN3|nr:hypothetical protein PPTG_09219 [Phytophthora nicotianae INRA-310]ETN12374.1 hypothetical protein PPTG_09219 [Phytophthora nicotianae INRA-310]